MFKPNNRTGFFADAKRSHALQTLDKKRGAPHKHHTQTTDSTFNKSDSPRTFNEIFESMNGNDNDKGKTNVPEKYHKMAQGFKDDHERERIKFQDQRTTEKVSHGIRTRHHPDDPFVKYSNPNDE